MGAGPGDPGLITAKGLRYLQQAEVLIYDRLVSVELLDEAPTTAERFYVGKQPDRHVVPQDEINALIVRSVRQGKRVVRLKGGDPFVFGRGGEEAMACVKAGIPFEVVPGVSSAFAVPAYAGIPVTYRGMARSVALVTGHQAMSDGIDGIDWQSLSRMDTLIILMGLRNLPEIAKQLVSHGLAPTTPVVTIEWGTLPHQRSVEGTLSTIGARVQEAGILSPALTVVGEVAALHTALDWYGKNPETVDHSES